VGYSPSAEAAQEAIRQEVDVVSRLIGTSAATAEDEVFGDVDKRAIVADQLADEHGAVGSVLHGAGEVSRGRAKRNPRDDWPQRTPPRFGERHAFDLVLQLLVEPQWS
jgi:hypothetical protein